MDIYLCIDAECIHIYIYKDFHITHINVHIKKRVDTWIHINAKYIFVQTQIYLCTDAKCIHIDFATFPFTNHLVPVSHLHPF